MPSVPSSNSSSSLAMAEGSPDTRAMPSAHCGDGADLLLAGRRRLVVVDVLLERVADLLRTNRELRHVFCLFPESRESWSEVVCVCRGRSARETTPGVVEPAGDGAVDDVVADLDPEAADEARVEDDVQLHRRGVLLAQRLGQPLLRRPRSARGRCAPSPRSPRAPRRPPRGTRSAPRRRCPAARRRPGRPASPWPARPGPTEAGDQPAAVLRGPRRVRERARGGRGWRRASGVRANSSSPTCLPFAPAERTVAMTASRSSASARSRRDGPAAERRVRDQRRARRRRRRAEDGRGQAGLAVALDRVVGQRPGAGPASPRRTADHPEELLAHVAGSASVPLPTRAARSSSPRASAEAPRSIKTSPRSRPPWRPPASRGRPGSGRPRGLLRSSSSRLSPTIRLGQRRGQRADLGAQRGQRLPGARPRSGRGRAR